MRYGVRYGVRYIMWGTVCVTVSVLSANSGEECHVLPVYILECTYEVATVLVH